MTSTYINALVGKTVSIWTTGQGANKDDGILDGFDGFVVRLRKEKGGKTETLLFPLTGIRLIKASE